MNQNLKYVFPVLLSLGILILACQSSSNLPNSFDQRVAEENTIGQIKQLVVESQKTDFYGTEVITGASEYLILGKYEEITSWILFRYGFSGLPVPDSSKIDSVQLWLYPSAARGDSTAQFQATAHLMGDLNYRWDELNMKWSTFAQDFEPTPLSEPVDVNSLEGDAIVFNFDIQQFTTPDSLLDSTIIENGFCIRFDPTESVDLLKRFYSCDYATTSLRPTLRIISKYRGVVDTTYDYSAHDVFIVNSTGLPADSSQFLYTGRGYAYHSLLDFDISEIPENATVNRARLKLVFAEETSILGMDPDINIRLYPVTDWPDRPEDVSIDSTTTGATSSTIEDTITVELRGKVQEWTAQLDANYGVFIRALNEGDDVSRMVFYGPPADSLVRPKLIIDYTIPRETEY